MNRRSPLAFVPFHGVLQTARPSAVAIFLSGYLMVCLFSSDPLLIIAATIGAGLAGTASGGAGAVAFSLKIGLLIGLFMVLVNALVTGRGATVLLRLGDPPLLGAVNVTLEALVAGAVIGLRVAGTMVVVGVWSACVDPDRVLTAASRFAGNSALTASLISRLVPLVAADRARLSEASRLRGPGAAPVTRAAMARRLLAGSLDRSVDIAATLELRGYGLAEQGLRPLKNATRFDRRLIVVGVLILILGTWAVLSGAGTLSPYPSIEWEITVPTVVAASLLITSGLISWRPGRRRHA